MIKQFGMNVRALVKVSGIKMGEFEKSIGLSKGFISRLCSGNTEFISLAATIKIAKYFDKSIDDLLTKDFVKDCEKKILEKQLEDAKARYDAELKELSAKLEEVK